MNDVTNSLEFDVTSIEGFQEICYDIDPETNTRRIGQYNELTHHMVLWAASVGVANVTKDNWKDFYTRVFMFELCASGGKRVPNPEYFKSFIGLRLLSMKPQPRSKFEANVIKALRDQAKVFIDRLEAANDVDDEPKIVV